MTDSSKVLLPGPVPAYLHRSTTEHPVIVHGRDQFHLLAVATAVFGAVVFAGVLIAAVVI